MATHSSVRAWGIPGMAEPGGLLSMGSHRVRHDRSDLAAAAAAASAASKRLSKKKKKKEHKKDSYNSKWYIQLFFL